MSHKDYILERRPVEDTSRRLANYPFSSDRFWLVVESVGESVLELSFGLIKIAAKANRVNIYFVGLQRWQY